METTFVLGKEFCNVCCEWMDINVDATSFDAERDPTIHLSGFHIHSTDPENDIILLPRRSIVLTDAQNLMGLLKG